MVSRRDFMKETAGAAASIVFTGCSLLSAPQARAQAKPSGKRREVLVAGRRARVIDVHAHCTIPEAHALLGLKPQSAIGPGIDEVGQRRLGEMDEFGIDMEVLSINPAWYRAERDVVTQVIKIQNEKLAEFCAKYPDRFAAFASLALQFPDLAVQQLEEGMKKYNLRGAAIGGSVAGVDFSDAKFHPVWAKAEELGAVLFIHPQSTPPLAARFKGNGWLSNTIGNPLDTTIALEKLIFEGTLDRHPGLKIIAAHGGGFLPSYAPRMDHSCRVNPAECNPNIVLKKKPTEYLRSLYFDSLVFTSEALRHLAAEVGTSQIVVGTDHPIPWNLHAVDHVLNAPSLSDAEKVAILGGNAAKLLNIK
ncbi:MAG TPA: amidohydrolase family protein [Burkholderiales bacterium]|nr:amidohydrolase family protein [Burkholderiales bacterium]